MGIEKVIPSELELVNIFGVNDNNLKYIKSIYPLLNINVRGNIIFIEPLGTNPIINLYRKFTPNARSKDEHPFTFDDIKQLRKLFNKVKIQYYGFFTLLFLPFYKSPKESKIFLILSRLDKILFTIPFLKFLAWSVLIKAKKN